ncbi:hypothetical protein [Brevundimonas sp. GCM10030266]|uniref:hypothetical protein n=1 Tax=Brevundimonas sp. GCM10030266 TaxID=3273386 RepID=UPI00360B80BF
MFGLILLGLAVVGGLGGWFVGNLKRKRRWLAISWILLPLWLAILLAIPVTFLAGGRGLMEWLMIIGILGYAIAAWIIPAALAFAVARYGDKMAGNLRAP